MLRLMHPWRWLLPALLSGTMLALPLAPAKQQPTLTDVTALRWVPKSGRLYATIDQGREWVMFDHHLNRLSDLDEEPDWKSLPSPLECSASGENMALEVLGPGGRTIRWQVDSGELLLCSAKWENQGTIQWGPGWAAVEFRCSRSLGPWLEWRDPSGIQHLSRVEVDGQNPLIQRAHLTGVPSSGKIQLRHRPVELSYPSRAWSDWLELEIPEVAVSGDRPTSMLHPTICGLRPVSKPR